MDYRTLITVDELASLLPESRAVLIDCRFSLADPTAGEMEYMTSHLPGAVYAHLDRDLSSPISPTSGRHPLPDASHLVARFAAWGIDHTKQVVAYDNSGGRLLRDCGGSRGGSALRKLPCSMEVSRHGKPRGCR